MPLKHGSIRVRGFYQVFNENVFYIERECLFNEIRIDLERMLHKEAACQCLDNSGKRGVIHEWSSQLPRSFRGGFRGASAGEAAFFLDKLRRITIWWKHVTEWKASVHLHQLQQQLFGAAQVSPRLLKQKLYIKQRTSKPTFHRIFRKASAREVLAHAGNL